MADQQADMAMESWAWVRGGELDLGGCLVFVRGVSAERLLEACGVEVDAARMLSLSGAQEEAWRTEQADEDVDVRWVRVGQAGGWAFAFEAVAVSLQKVAMPVSVGTEAIAITWTQATWNFACYVDGEVGTSFDVGMGWHRYGNDPDRFLTEMRLVGLDTEPPPVSAPEREYSDPVVQSLAMVTLALGIAVSEGVARGPLLTCQRRIERSFPARRSWSSPRARAEAEERTRQIEEWAARHGKRVVNRGRIWFPDEGEDPAG